MNPLHPYNIPSHTVTRKKPINLSETDRHLFEHELKKEIPTIETRYYNNVTILPNFKLLQKNRNIDIPNLNFYTGNIQNRIDTFRKETIKIDEAIWCINLWSNNYFHWFTDVLPKLIFIFTKKTDATLIVPKDFSNITYIKQSLELFPCLKVIWQAKYQKVKVKKLHYIPDLAPTGNYNEDLLKKLNFFMRKKLNLSEINTIDKTFVSRQNSPTRKILNWEDVLFILTNHNIKPIYFEEYNWKQQVKIAAFSSILIGVHGAGLTNMLFMKPGSTIIELRKKGDSQNNCYFSLASALGHRYYYILCDVDNEKEITQKNQFFLPTNLLKSTLELL